MKALRIKKRLWIKPRICPECDKFCLLADNYASVRCTKCHRHRKHVQKRAKLKAKFGNRRGKYTSSYMAARKKAIADGTLAATEVPFRNMQLAYEGLKIAKTLVGHSNPNCASDLGVGILQLRACVYGAWLNVKINLPGVKDVDKARYFEEEGQKMFASAGDIARKYFNEVNMSL